MEAVAAGISGRLTNDEFWGIMEKACDTGETLLPGETRRKPTTAFRFSPDGG